MRPNPHTPPQTGQRSPVTDRQSISFCSNASLYSQMELKLLTYTCWMYWIQLPGSPVRETGFPFLFSLAGQFFEVLFLPRFFDREDNPGQLSLQISRL
jgi:hypothetical protein